MLYFKKAELAETYHVSEKTVTNWIKEAKLGKLDLELHEENERAWIANTTRNIMLIEQLVEMRKKFRNSRGIKTISPKSTFYDTYNQQQIFDIVSNLDIHHEIPFQYSYFDGGADDWDKYAKRLGSEKVLNFLTSTVQQLHTSQEYIDHLLVRYTRVNVIDIGPGNAMPVRGLLQHLLDQHKLGRYIALDISSRMLKLTERNMEAWFGRTTEYESHLVDMNHDRFTEWLVDDAVGEVAQNMINVVTCFGGMLSNLRSPDGAFRSIHDSMNRNDLLVYSLKLDSEAARQYFDFNVGDKVQALDIQTKMLLDMLNINDSFYDVEMGFDLEHQERYIRVRLKVALIINFKFEKGERSITLNKNDVILLWRYAHQGVQDVIRQLDRNDFDVLQTSLTEDKDYLLTVSRVKTES
jgi:uncharacterized SAM-dependent methyltransferase